MAAFSGSVTRRKYARLQKMSMVSFGLTTPTDFRTFASFRNYETMETTCASLALSFNTSSKALKLHAKNPNSSIDVVRVRAH
jgi:hypothetical protein